MLAPASDAFVMVTVPAFDFLWSPWDDAEKHKRRYTKKQLANLLERAGFRVEHLTYFFAPLFFAALGMKGLRKLLPSKPRHMSDLTESKNVDALNRVVLGVHEPERRWLGRGRRLPFGTSVLALARHRT